jgi:hypothetical protein
VTIQVAMWLLGILVSIMVPAVVGLLAWVWSLWQSHNNLKLKVAEEYPKAQALSDIKRDIESLRDVVYRIALKMDVPVFTEPHR